MIGGECVSVYVKGERKTVRDGNGGSLQARREVRHGGIWQLFKKRKMGTFREAPEGLQGEV